MHSRRHAMIAALFSLAACQPAAGAFDTDADVRACERYIMATVEAPESYRRVSLTRTDQPISADALATAIGELGQSVAYRGLIDLWAEEGLKLRELKIESTGGDDGGNARRTDICRFVLVGGKLAEDVDLERGARDAINAYEFREMVRNGVVPGISPDLAEPEPEFPCCLPG